MSLKPPEVVRLLGRRCVRIEQVKVSRRVTFRSIAGFPLAIRDYYQRIRRLLDNIDELAKEVLPANRDIVNRFTGSFAVITVHAFMAGIWGSEVDPPMLELFQRFEEYVETEENSVFTVLSGLHYNLDAPNTVQMVLGTRHAEKVHCFRSPELRACHSSRNCSGCSQS